MTMADVNKIAIKWQLMNFLSNNDDIQQEQIIYQSNTSNNADHVDVVGSKYRKIDDTFIIVMAEMFIKVIIKNSNKLDDIL